jgi:hypothetical protein
MWVWSKGLGQAVMPLDLSKVEVLVEPEKMVLKGRIVAPKVHWKYAITMREQDLVDFMGLLNEPQVVEYLVHEGWLRQLGSLLGRAVWIGLLYFWAEGRRLWNFSRRG